MGQDFDDEDDEGEEDDEEDESVGEGTEAGAEERRLPRLENEDKQRSATTDTKSDYDIIEVEEARTLEEKERKEREMMEREEQEGKDERKSAAKEGAAGKGREGMEAVL